MVETSFPPKRPDVAPLNSPLFGVSGVSAASVAVPHPSDSPLETTATEGSATPQSPRKCGNPNCDKTVTGNATCCDSTCRKALWRIEQRKKRSDEPKTGAGNFIKNFLGEKISSARNFVAQKISTGDAPGAVSADCGVEVALGQLAAPAGSVDRGKAFRKVCRAGVKTLVRVANTALKFFARKKGASEKFIETELLRDVAPVEDVENFTEALDDYLRSINYVPQKPEAVALIIAAVNLGGGYVGAVAALSKIQPEKTEEKK